MWRKNGNIYTKRANDLRMKVSAPNRLHHAFVWSVECDGVQLRAGAATRLDDAQLHAAICVWQETTAARLIEVLVAQLLVSTEFEERCKQENVGSHATMLFVCWLVEQRIDPLSKTLDELVIEYRKMLAYTLGKFAFSTGGPAAPAQSEVFMLMLQRIEHFIEDKSIGWSIPYLKAFSDGWHKANLAAPVAA